MTKTLAIAVATYNQGDVELRGMIYGLLAQTNNNFKTYVCHDGPSIDSTKAFMAEICAKYPDNFEYIESETRRALWGHPGRQYALDVCEESYITFTNADNLFMKDYVLFINRCLTAYPGTDVFTNTIVHNYFNYNPFHGDKFAICQTDFANFIVKTDKAKQVPFRVNEFAADGHFIEDFKKKFPTHTRVHIPHILAVHQ